MTTFPRTWAEVDLRALRHNLQQIRARLSPPARLALVVKADAYGHGLVPISRAAVRLGADWVAVATVQEGIALREAEVDAPIIVLAPVLALEAPQVVFYGLRSLVESFETAEAISKEAEKQERTARIHLKIDTGMSRFGVQAEEAAGLAARIASLPAMEMEGAATHFADAAGSPDYTRWQFDRFRKALHEMKAAGVQVAIRHCANSAALALFPEAVLDMVRIGVFAYGIKHVETDLDLRPVLSWKARVMAMRCLPPGRKIGYVRTYETDRPSRIATLGAGYGDGYHRALSNRAEVVIHGKRAPVRGIVAMDQIMVDVTDIPEAKVGDAAGLIEPPITAESLAKIVDTTPHEIPTRIMSRVPRRYSSA
ncbi:MAG: alanine racemase [Armatimonadetes bacterium]|nr:alanine racemase [Armatimonadota bacterium]